MKKLILMILLSVFAQQVFAFSDVQEKGFLRVAVYKNYAPFSFRANLKLEGIEVELGKLLAAKLDVDPLIWSIGADETMDDDLRNAIWKGHYLGGGTADVMLHVPVNKKFAAANDHVIIANPYFKDEIVAVSKSSVTSSSLIKMFSQSLTGVELDTLSDFYMLGVMGGRFRENVKHFSSIELAVEALRSGEVSSVVGPRSQIESALSAEQSEYLFTRVTMPRHYQSSWVVGIAVKEGREELISKLSWALDELKSSGQLEALFKKYHTTYLTP